ncbi:hypothetical protein GCM10011519_19590 [Marmoricola endophyticus]|uniref:HTH luxR-type domain-containing protein n=1 Tax=Marmoricola endophyticus TaxID=2040280 RepID=A0A917F5L9_9ACTN|nr:LuxR C-terminal-related transcriptional regulator [Marmoricola endophyticus]GGF45774.1 hypothetical protein GCM10011519_19590 [Marmoricola endophyticus]
MFTDVHSFSTLPLRSNHPVPGQDWPGRHEGLTVRESDILLLVAHGLCNQDISERLFLSINSIKSYIRSAYRKMAVESRTQAVLWAIEHGFRPDLTVVEEHRPAV